MQYAETPVFFNCQGDRLLGIIHHSDENAQIGVLLVVGGPQYRPGSHRQFVLLARYLAQHGIPVMRFDVRGMGDSDGEPRCFDELDADIGSAIDCFLSTLNLQRIVIWGLCDAASAALFYAYQDQRVVGLVLLNPWVFTEQGAAKTFLKYYYLQRLLSKEFWLKLFTFRFDYAHSLASLLDFLQKAAVRKKLSISTHSSVKIDKSLALPTRMRECLRRFNAPVLIILSGRDLIADEFRETVKEDSVWKELLSDERVNCLHFDEADHTFSSAVWKDQVARWTKEWVKNLA